MERNDYTWVVSFLIDDEEKAIEKEINYLKPISGKKKEKINNIISQAKKNKSISLRILNYNVTSQ